MAGRECRCDDCIAAHRAHTSADTVALRDGYLRLAFRGGCPVHKDECHTYCHACSNRFANIERLELVVPGFD